LLNNQKHRQVNMNQTEGETMMSRRGTETQLLNMKMWLCYKMSNKQAGTEPKATGRRHGILPIVRYRRGVGSAGEAAREAVEMACRCCGRRSTAGIVCQNVNEAKQMI